MEHVRCVVERITYCNEENGYTVLRTRVKGYQDLVTVVGNLAAVNVGSVLLVSGQWKLDSKYGRQFIVQQWEETLPLTVYGIEKYLGSGMIKGLGPKYARRIVEKFGEDTLTVIEETPEQLNDIPGIGDKRIAMIKKAWVEQKEIKAIMIFLQAHGVNATHAVKIFKQYGNDSINIVKENPYKLADDIWGIGFKTADTIAQKMGFTKDSPYRCRSGLLYVLNEFADEGHCYVECGALIEKANVLLDIDAGIVTEMITRMITAKDVVCEPPERIYLPPLWFCEKGVVQRLRRIMAEPRKPAAIDIESSITRAEQGVGLVYDDVQREAIRRASESKVFILTGGPGVGKTTTTMGIIAAFSEQGLQVLLAAPTGRAAKRLSETTGREAKTIHRLLESKPPSGYAKNADNPLKGDVLIVDECSMIVILVGDADQLPSVGPGNVLRDLIASAILPVVCLTQIYRQARHSQIIINAHRINQGQYPYLKSGKHSDFFFIEENEPSQIPALISQLCTERLPNYYHVDPIQGIQVLTPMQRTETGAANLNGVLQNALNPTTLCLRRGGTEYRQGDKVMQIKNNYDKGVFNGDIGVITSVDTEERELKVAFDDKCVAYDVSELDELMLAYATTIHKAQGSEYPIVVMPFTTQHFMMLQRNLLYTGVTRAKKVCIVVGMKKAISYAVRNDKVAARNTLLAERLTEQLTE